MGTVKIRGFTQCDPERKPRVTEEILRIALAYDKRYGTNEYPRLLKRSHEESWDACEELHERYGYGQTD